MSAYIVDKKHIQFLVLAACSRQILGHLNSTFRWYWGDEWHELPQRDADRKAEVGNMLWRENIKSVSHRYPNESSATLPGPCDGSFVLTDSDFGCVLLWDSFEPAQVLKACDCFEYQSCEHDGWETSEAKAFIEALRHSAWHALPDYDAAEWGAPKTIAEKRAEYRNKLTASRL